MTFYLTDDKPIYKQLMEQILSKIKTGELPPGSRLPTERELAQQLQIARGTVKKAYKELADNNIIEVIQGSGSYVYTDKTAFNSERHKLASQLINETLNKLAFWDFSPDEISMLMRMELAKQQHTGKLIRIAIVDCCPESLSAFKQQLSCLPNTSLSMFMIENILMDDDPKGLLSDFDMVVTTTHHFDAITDALRGCQIAILPVSFSLSKQTIISLRSITTETTIGIVCSSNKFANLVCEQLDLFCPHHLPIHIYFEGSPQPVDQFISQYNAIVLSPNFEITRTKTESSAFTQYAANGGTVILFEYLVDKASLIYLEDHVQTLMRTKYTGDSSLSFSE